MRPKTELKRAFQNALHSVSACFFWGGRVPSRKLPPNLGGFIPPLLGLCLTIMPQHTEFATTLEGCIENLPAT